MKQGKTAAPGNDQAPGVQDPDEKIPFGGWFRREPWRSWEQVSQRSCDWKQLGHVISGRQDMKKHQGRDDLSLQPLESRRR
jgi:hypothetical protein